MERLAELISKLKEQFEQKADSSKLLATTLLIERELMKLESAQTPAMSSSMVSVVMPALRNGHRAQESILVTEEVKQSVSEPIRPEPPASKTMEETTEFTFNPITEIPTLSQQ